MKASKNSNNINKVSVLLRLTLGAALLTGTITSTAYAETAPANSPAVTVAVQEQDLHAQWTNLLKQNVLPINKGHSTAVNYANFKQQETQLKAYLSKLSNVSRKEFDSWPKQKQLAFLINAYNAWTVEFILTKYPDLDSIKDLGSLFKSPWDNSFIPLLGKTVSLNDIEHGLIRGSGRYNDPRIHFAVNCASIGCPALREEAYIGDKLEQQLTEQTERFLTDTSRNQFDKNNARISSIFKWYKEDFEKGYGGAKSLQNFILLYANVLKLDDKQKLALKNNDIDVDFLDYNWNLNANH
jgi:hypothetical protein